MDEECEFKFDWLNQILPFKATLGSWLEVMFIISVMDGIAAHIGINLPSWSCYAVLGGQVLGNFFDLAHRN